MLLLCLVIFVLNFLSFSDVGGVGIFGKFWLIVIQGSGYFFTICSYVSPEAESDGEDRDTVVRKRRNRLKKMHVERKAPER